MVADGHTVHMVAGGPLVALSLPRPAGDAGISLIVDNGGMEKAKGDPRIVRMFRVRRDHVRRVKELLLRHNKYYLYKDIDEEALNHLPLDGTPEDLPILMEDRPLPALGMAAYWERTEYQSCGSAHAHALWWHGNPPPDAFLDVITGCAGG